MSGEKPSYQRERPSKRLPYAFSESQIDHLFELSTMMREEPAYRKEIGVEIAQLFAYGIQRRHPHKKLDFNLSLWRGPNEYLHYRSRNTLAMDFPRREGYVYAQLHDVLRTGAFTDIMELEQYVQYGGGFAHKVEKPQRFVERTFYELQALTNDVKKARADGNIALATGIQELKAHLLVDRVLANSAVLPRQNDLQIHLHHDPSGLPERDKLVFSLVDTKQNKRVYATTPPPAYLHESEIREKYAAALRPLGITAYGQIDSLLLQ